MVGYSRYPEIHTESLVWNRNSALKSDTYCLKYSNAIFSTEKMTDVGYYKQLYYKKMMEVQPL